jgi:predicted Zn-ribbon and HTH transcriptional regulator
MTSQATQILEILQSKPGLTVREISKLLGKNPDDRKQYTRVGVITSTMKKDGLLRSDFEPGGNKRRIYFAASQHHDKPTPPPEIKPEQIGNLIVRKVSASSTVELQPAIELIASSVADVLGKALAASLQRVVEEQVQKAITLASEQVASLTGQGKPVTAAATQEKTSSAPRVTVVGLLPGQVDMIRREFGQELHLSFVNSDKTEADRLRKLCQNSSHVISMCAFMSHSTESVIKTTRAHHTRISGGMSSLRERLTAIYVEATSTLQ